MSDSESENVGGATGGSDANITPLDVRPKQFSLSTSDGGNILECFRKLEVIPDTDSTESFMQWMKEYLESTGHHGTDDVEVPLEARDTRPKRTNPVKLELPSQIQQPKLLTTKHDPSATPTTSLHRLTSGRTTLALPRDEFRAIEQPTDIITEPSKDNAPGDNIVEDLAPVNPENDVTESELPPVPPAELEVRPTRLRQPPQWVQSGEYILSQQPVNFSTSQRRTELARSLLPADFSTLAHDRLRVVLEMLPTLCKSLFPEEFNT
ncbi:hypothetical protein LOTGIDRAFT_165251 [Lottia gigantea]|uniref:Uncharacterized protein n=1 Tax=Lottia gigantea TaxID=225164 RepID=V3ZWU7_LOTGI|nr:hypothetical protein LOTGIDRAFT_165251 [Lottia gigantea]ESO88832.1 hypothetical protein LOTGIDRAFT_165251 [Lottia gigantea]